MENINNSIIEKLNRLIAIALYTRNNYINAAENLQNETMKKSLLQNAKERATDITELYSIVEGLGGFHKETDVMHNNLNNKETNGKSTFTLINEDFLINECIAGDDALINAYNEALAGNKIFGSIRDILMYQLSGVKNAIKYIRIYLRKAS
jgi:uncharacterized protein (TIGR02284 family)